MPAAALIVALLGFLLGERVEVNGGLGWDGVIYARWARDFNQEVFVRGVDTYYIQRILPAAMVHYGLRVLGVARTDANIMSAFGLLSVILLTLMGYLWALIAERLVLGRAGTWLGFCGLFLNYVVLKHTFYCPVTTDTWAYAIGLAMLWSYLDDRPSWLCILILISGFTWPLAVYVGALLLLFPRNTVVDRNPVPANRLLLAAVAGLSGLLAYLGIRYVLHVGPSLAHGLVDDPYLQPMHALLRLSEAISVAYVIAGVGVLLNWDRFFDWKGLFRPLWSWRVPAVAILFALLGALHWQWSNRQQFMGMTDLLVLTGFATVAKPGVFLVTHFAYYGPFFLLMLFVWSPVCRHLHQQGLGLCLAVLLGLLLSLNSQSRYFLNIFVMVVPFLVKATEPLRWRPWQYVLLAGLCLFCSKCWLIINVEPFTGKLLEFPDQYMFMSHGPWIATSMYLVQGVVALVLGYVLCRICFRSYPGQQES